MTLENLIGKGLSREPSSAEEIRRQRAAGLYDGSFEPSEAEVQSLLAVLAELKSHFENWLSENHPELVSAADSSRSASPLTMDSNLILERGTDLGNHVRSSA